MENITDLYNTIESMKKVGLTITPEQLNQIKEKENEFVQNNILPSLEEAIEPIINAIRRELVLIIDYIPNEGLTVSLSRRRKLSYTEEKKPIGGPRAAPIRITTSGKKAKKTVLSVKFPDGKIISEYYAYQTLALVIERLEIERIRSLNMYCCGVPFISRKMDEFYNQYEIKQGVFLMTHSSTETKKQQLDEISQRLNLGLRVDIVYP